jgi:hypothetical protein
MSNDAVGYLISLVLVLFVIRQVRGLVVDTFNLLLPLVLVGAAAAYYLRSVPSVGNDITLDAVLIVVGLLLGIGNGLFTRVYRISPKKILAKSGFIAAALWIVGMGARSVFVYEADHGGAHSIASFSEKHRITGAAAWTAALVFMALAEVLARLVILRIKGHSAKADHEGVHSKPSKKASESKIAEA